MQWVTANLWLVFGLLGVGLLLLYIKVNIKLLISLSISLFIVAILDMFYPFDISGAILLLIFLVIIMEAIRYVFLVAYNDEEPYVPKYQQINHHGRVIAEIKRGKKGKVLLDAPLLGDEIWLAISDEHIEKGERIIIEEIRGQILLVKRES
ncbi:MAG: hypothetical protein GXO31_06440 [Epsilonproteobacteria bacterium]|nr:hypothetical protein [Campylobacterota bacterium]